MSDIDRITIILPKRIQRRRTKGWTAPEGAVNVARPGRWGNPFVITEFMGVVVEFGAYQASTRQDLVDLYRELARRNPDMAVRARAELAGKDLMCWCPLDQPCHADVLLELANEQPAGTGGRA